MFWRSGRAVKIDLLVYAHEDSPGELGGIRKPIELAKALATLGHEAVVYLPMWVEVESDTVELVRYAAVRRRILRPVSAYLAMSWKLWRRSKSAPPDLVYLRASRNFLTGLVARGIGARLIFEVNGDAFGEQGWRRGILRALGILSADWANCRLAHQVIALTPGLAEMVQRRYRVSAHKVRCIGSGTNLEEIRPVDPVCSRKSLGIEAATPVIAFLGVLYEHQGVQILLDAMPRILSEEPCACALIIGDGPMMGRLRERAEALDVIESVMFVGSVPYGRVREYLGAATCCVAPFLADRGEASPLKIFDYLAAGRPVIASEIPSIGGLIQVTDAVVRVPPEDPARLAEEILRLLGEPARCKALGDAGRTFVERHHGWHGIAERLISACADGQQDERGITR